MEKTKTMKKFEERTGKQAIYWTAFGPEISQEYIDEIEAGYEAYDRLMSGRKKTLKEWANFLGMAVAVDRYGATWAYPYRPIRGMAIWRSDGDNWSIGAFEIPKNLVDYTGDWKDSLTLPDGWEEKQ